MKKKVDSRIKTLTENNILLGERTMFLVIGDQGKNVVVNFYFLLNRLVSKTHNILWCYNKKLDFATSKKKRFKDMKKKIKKGSFDTTVDTNFDIFLKNANIRFCYYKETQKILGQTYSICVLQDFAYITPNILCRCIETVIGGGLIIFLLNKQEELKNIYNLTLNFHKKYTMNGICGIYNNYINRFFLSLNKCNNAMFIDDEMNILPLNDNHLHIKKLSNNENTTSGVDHVKVHKFSNISDNEEKNKFVSNTDNVHNSDNKKEKKNNKSNFATLGGFISPDKNMLKDRLKALKKICEENEKKKEEKKLFLYSPEFYLNSNNNNKIASTKLINKNKNDNGSDGGDGGDGDDGIDGSDGGDGDDNEGVRKNDKLYKNYPPKQQQLQQQLQQNANTYNYLDRNIMNILQICLSLDQLDILLNICKILNSDDGEENKKKRVYIKEILINLLANRGRGKSATLGLILSLSIYFNYNNIIVCSGNPEGTETIFEFLDKGLNLLGYNEFLDYEKIYENKKLKEIVILKNKKYLKQRIKYINILDEDIMNNELMIIDEAACIPIDILRNKIKGEITILSTTLNGYEGTGKTFTFKLLKQLKKNL
uniref:RNA cytidine acetyltransferase n=1 Tax=Piliocolobus tephrosceles TaxID=591936 RepID=A0A8C9HCG3_9PRIM